MSSQAGSSENTDPNNKPNRSAQQSHPQPTKNRQQPQQQTQPRTVGATPFKSFDMKQLTSEMKRLADSGKLFNVMREVDRRGGLRGLQGFCVARGAAASGRRGGRRGNNGKQQQPPIVAPDEPSTSGLNNY